MPFGYTKQPVKAVVTDYSIVRNLDVIYQNTSGRPKLVILSINHERTVGGAGNYAHVEVFVEDATPPTDSVTISGLPDLAGSPKETIHSVVSFAVPNNYYYKAQSASVNGVNSRNRWIEVEL